MSIIEIEDRLYYIENLIVEGNLDEEILLSLYNELKKLKEDIKYL